MGFLSLKMPPNPNEEQHLERKRASDYDPELLALYDGYVHGQINRRDFLGKASRFAVGGVTAAALLDSLMPDYALAQQIPRDDERIAARYQEYESPKGYGTMRGYLVQPAKAAGKIPGVVVVHENRGLNPYIEDVVRRLGVAGFLAFAPDALTPLGGYPGSEDEGRRMQGELDRNKITEDFIAAARFLKSHAASSGKVGVVGFCFGGGMANTLAVRIPDVISAAVPFYGSQPAAEDVPRIKAIMQRWTTESTRGGQRMKPRSKKQAWTTRCTCMKRRTTDSTTTRRLVMTNRPQNWPGSVPLSSLTGR